jgi:GTP-binding protein
MKFIDEVRITVASGKGGPGHVSFRRETLVPRGGPDGGDGGRGGDVIFKVETHLHSLLDLRFQKSYKAADGEPGAQQNKSGSAGKDLILKVPPGTLVKDVQGNILHDLTDVSEMVFLKGGIGGKGNTFYKSSVNQAPSVAQKGMPGEQMEIQLELKLLADVGIVGLPNAGKSTLISKISSAKPKIADYPFTTLVPNLGVVRFREELSFVVADIPGLIEGAHKGAGLGIQFLRHIERTRFFVHMIDASGLDGKVPIDAYREIRRELELYDVSKKDDDQYLALATRPEVIVLNKIDTIPTEKLDEIKATFKNQGLEVMTASAVTGKNVKELVEMMGRRIFNDNNT